MAKSKKQTEAPKVEEPEKEQEAVVEQKAAPVIHGGLRRVKVSHDELMKLQHEKKLIGYDPATQEAIIK